MFWRTWVARYLHLPGACVEVKILVPLSCCRLQSVCQCPICMDQRHEGVGHFQKQVFSCGVRTGNASASGSANQIDRLTRLDELNCHLFSLTQFSEEKEFHAPVGIDPP